VSPRVKSEYGVPAGTLEAMAGLGTTASLEAKRTVEMGATILGGGWVLCGRGVGSAGEED
jgi:hypothetical protein